MQKLNYVRDYPLSEKRKELIETPTGKKVDEITMENLLQGKISSQDCRISAKTLEYQAQIAESAFNTQVAENFRRAAELTAFPDEKVLEIY
ncbi:MAG: diol dehydratase small subunit, partial [Anaerovoracaceae bacterium]